MARPAARITRSALCRQRRVELGDERLALLQRRDAAILGEDGGTGVVALGQHRHRLDQVARVHHPAQPPAGHRPGLGEAVEHEHRLVRAGELQEGRRRVGAGQHVAVVDLVGDQPEPVPPAQVEQRLLAGSAVITQPVGLEGLLT